MGLEFGSLALFFCAFEMNAAPKNKASLQIKFLGLF
jgi:hypothetical protein